MLIHRALTIVLTSRHITYFDLAIVSKTSRELRRVVSEILSSRINSLLSNWLTPDARFWSMLDDTRAVIAGAFALRVLDLANDDWRPEALDIYISKDSAVFVHLQSVLKEAGYLEWSYTSFKRRPRWRVDGRLAWVEEVVIEGLHEAISANRIIRVFTVDHCDPLATIPYGWSTLFINAITPAYILCAYPKATLYRRGYMTANVWEDACVDALAELASEGFRNRAWGVVRSDGSSIHQGPMYKVTDLRSFTDSQVLRFDLDTSTLSDASLSNSFAKTRAMLASWQYGMSLMLCEDSISYSLLLSDRTQRARWHVCSPACMVGR